MEDTLFQDNLGGAGSFKFSGAVVEVFQDMIQRSVPGYGLTLEMIGIVARKAFGNNAGLAYDLGCSLGASLYPVLEHTQAHVIGVDLSSEMLEKAQTHLQPTFPGRFTLQRADLTSFQFPDTDLSTRLITSNFTLQFLPVNERLALLQRAYDALSDGGILLLSEKFTHTHPGDNKILIDLHHTFKASMGYSELEIARKRDAIENVLIPESSETHLHRLHAAGFKTALCWYQCFNFASYLAIK